MRWIYSKEILKFYVMVPPKTRNLWSRRSESTDPPDGPGPSKTVNAANPSTRRGQQQGLQAQVQRGQQVQQQGQQVQAVAAV